MTLTRGIAMPHVTHKDLTRGIFFIFFFKKLKKLKRNKKRVKYVFGPLTFSKFWN